MRLIVLYGLALVTAGCSARVNVVRVPPTPIPSPALGEPSTELKGTIYALPRTVVKVKLPVERVTKTPGKYPELADLFVPGRKPVLSSGSVRVSSFSVKRAAFSTFGEPDPDNVYAVALSKGGALDQDLSVELTEQGSVSGADVRVENQTADIVLSTIGAITGVVSRAIIGAAAPCPANPDFDQFLDCNELRDNFATLSATRQAELKTTYSNDKTRLLAAAKDYKAVRDTAGRISTLLSGTGGGLNPGVLIDENRKELDNLLQRLFLGTSESATWEPEFEYRPPNAGISTWITAPTRKDESLLFRYVKERGVCLTGMADLRGGEPPPDAFKAADCTGSKALSLVFKLDSEPSGEQLVAMVRRNYKDPADPGLRYRIPARMRVTVEEEGETKPASETRLTIAQFGLVAALPASVDSKTINYSLKFYEATGALKSFKLGSKPNLGKGTVDALSGDVNSILDAEKKRADANDTLAQRQRVRQLLEEEQKIRAACAALGKDDCKVP